MQVLPAPRRPSSEMAKPITNADLFFVIFVAGYIFKWWIDTLQIALVANGRSFIIFRTMRSPLIRVFTFVSYDSLSRVRAESAAIEYVSGIPAGIFVRHLSIHAQKRIAIFFE